MSIGIYKITNKINNKSYIGQSVNIESRWKEHIKCGLNENHTYNNYPLYRSFRKYGLDNFNFEIIEECRIDELNIKEKYYIKYYNTYEDGYNQTLGGQTSSGVKLNAKSIQELIKDLQTDATYADLSIKYNVNEYTLSRINNGHSWHQDNIKYPISNKRK